MDYIFPALILVQASVGVAFSTMIVAYALQMQWYSRVDLCYNKTARYE